MADVGLGGRPLRPLTIVVAASVVLTGVLASDFAQPITVLGGIHVHDAPRSLPGVHAMHVVLPDGASADGRIAVPRETDPSWLVVVCHAYGVPASRLDEFLATLADKGAVAIAME